MKENLEKVGLGKFVGTHGVRGELKLLPYITPEQLDDYVEDFLKTSKHKPVNLYAGNMEYAVTGLRTHKRVLLVTLRVVNDKDRADRLVGKEVFINSGDLPELPPNEYYDHELIGMDVWAVGLEGPGGAEGASGPKGGGVADSTQPAASKEASGPKGAGGVADSTQPAASKEASGPKGAGGVADSTQPAATEETSGAAAETKVFEVDKGLTYLGKLENIIITGSNDVYEVNGPLGEVLIPAIIDDVILDVDVPNKKLIVHLLEGLLPE